MTPDGLRAKQTLFKTQPEYLESNNFLTCIRSVTNLERQASEQHAGIYMQIVHMFICSA